MSGPDPLHVTKPRALFPLIRHLSHPVTLVLLKTPLTANQATFASMLFGLAAAYYFSIGEYNAGVLGSACLFANYLLDHCDGEIARAKKTSGHFGHELDTFVDWIVHTALFAAMGQGAFVQTGQVIWLWFGLAAAAGGTINYVLPRYWKWRDRNSKAAPDSRAPEPNSEAEKRSLKTVLIGAFRELARADFWLIVLALAMADWMRYLLPLAAVGAQVYWILLFAVRDENNHV
jgi:phosphatidylglycerophosphate synthase